MERKNTRRGCTQENKNVIIKNSHSRKFLSGIFHAGCNQIRKKALLNKYVEDPRLQPSGMTPLFNNGGFTLIELLVVVLIIGILAAVALPQYNKAVLKSRLTEGQLLLKAHVQAQQAYYLAHGEYCDNTCLSQKKLDIDFPEGTSWEAMFSTGNGREDETDIPAIQIYTDNILYDGYTFVAFSYYPTVGKNACVVDTGNNICKLLNTTKGDCLGTDLADGMDCWYFN